MTNSDDENDLVLLNEVRNMINAPAPGSTARLALELPASHDGLPYDFSGKQDLHHYLAPNMCANLAYH